MQTISFFHTPHGLIRNSTHGFISNILADIAANIKTVSKPTAQKILVALAEKGELTQKTSGKQTYFVANQVCIKFCSPSRGILCLLAGF